MFYEIYNEINCHVFNFFKKWSNEKDNCSCQANHCFLLLVGSTTGRNVLSGENVLCCS